MSLGKEMFELGVTITALDHFTRPMREAQKTMSQTQKNINDLTKSLALMGKSDKEIQQLTADFQRLHRAADFSGMARDLKKIGMSAQEIDKVKNSYMEVVKAQEQHARQTAKLQSISQKGTTTMGYGLAVTGASASAAKDMWDWLKEAGDFQNKLVSIGAITGANSDEMDNFGNKIMEVSRQVTKFNDIQLADMAQTLASNGFTKEQVDKLLLPTAQYAEIQEYTGKGDAQSSAKSASEMAHLMGHYDPESYYKFLNTMNKYSLLQPGDSGDLMQTLKYLAPTSMREMKMSEEDTMTMAALANMVGLNGSHGGTNAADMVLRLIPGLVGGEPTKKKTPKAWEAMQQLGFLDKNGKSVFFDDSGHLTDLPNILQYLVHASKTHTPEELTKYYHDMFGIQGGRAASILGDPKTIELMERVLNQKKNIEDIEPFVKKLQDTTAGKQNLFDSNKMSLMINLSKQLAIALNPVLDDMNGILKKTLEFTQQHPQIAKLTMEFGAMAVAAGLILGPIATLAGGIMTLVANWKLVRTAATEAAAAEDLAVASGAGLLRLMGLLGLIGGIAYVGDKISEKFRDMDKNAMPVRDQKLFPPANPSGMPKGVDDKQALQDYLSNGSPAPNSSFHSIMYLPKKAWGGIVSSPVIAGEDGTEVIIPLTKGGRGVSLWKQAGAALGANSDGVIISPGAIVINTQPDQDENAIAEMVVRRLGRIMQRDAMSSGLRQNMSAMG